LTPRNLFHDPNCPGFLENLYLGNFRWDKIYPFPQQDPADEKVGDEALERLLRLLTERVDPTEVDVTRRLPDGLVEELGSGGFLRLQAPRELGGLELSCYNVFRIVQLAASRSMPVGLVIAIQNAIGVGALLPALPPGPLRDMVRDRVANGVISGSADTEPSGSANARRDTIAEEVEDGRAFLLTGKKIYIGNGSIAELITVSATVREGDRERARLFFVDTAAPGFRVESRHEFMGLKGFPNASLILDRVRVPREHMFVEADQGVEVRITAELTNLIARGRLYLIVAPALAIAKQCLEWSRQFVNRRAIDGRPLGGYDEIQRIVAASMADVFAIEAIAEWSLLCEDRDVRGVNVRFEQTVAKNIGSDACWRVVDRAMSVLAGEGFETASSKARRGVQPLPLERCFRDARNFRISGAVDFQIDFWCAQLLIFSYYYPERYDEYESGGAEVSCPELSPENQGHLRFSVAETRRFGAACRRLAADQPAKELFEREHLLISLNRIVDEILTMSLVLARAARMAGDGNDEGQKLANIYCVEARDRIAALWLEVERRAEPEYAEVSDGWLAGDGFADLTRGVITDVPQVPADCLEP
jgi:alkylation response protein AidB-like acyl-CoA dehydrogenase